MDSNRLAQRALVQRYLIGETTAAETRELDELLANHPELRRDFVAAAAIDAGLRDIAFKQTVEDSVDSASLHENSRGNHQDGWSKWLLPALLVGLAATFLAVITIGRPFASPASIATLVSSENAAWESSLPTTTGSSLTPGTLKLITGIATIRFRSGAEVMIEAPATLEVISAMRGKLSGGAAVVSVPEPAIGFVLETPDGYVVDHGTQFAVNVGGLGKPSDFEVIAGEISVHLASTGEEVRLTEQQTASISQRTLTSFDGQLPEEMLEESAPVLRIGTNGRAGSVIRNDKRKKRIRPETLMVKTAGATGNWDQRSFFSFDISTVDLETTNSVRLRLNLVPSGIGFATRLPKINRFAIYGLTNEAKDQWEIESLWDDAPSPQDGMLLGTFEIPRSQQRGSVGIENEQLMEFLRNNQHRPITLILVRETGQINGEGPGLIHTFASDSHPEASGPILEFLLQ